MKHHDKQRSILHPGKSQIPQLIFRYGLVLALILTIIQAGSFLLGGDNSSSIAINDILAAVSGVIAVCGLTYGTFWSYRLDRRLGHSWLWFTLGMATWAAGDILWAYYELVLGEVPYPFIGDVLYLIEYPLFFLAIWLLPREQTERSRAAWLWLDLFIVFFAALGIYWNFLIGPLVLDQGQPWLAVAVSTAYPVGDLLVVLGITLIIFLPRSPLWLKPLLLMLIGQALTAIGDGVFSYQMINESYDSGALFNILFSVGPLFLMLSGLMQAVAASRVLRGPDTIPVGPVWPGALTLLRLLTPFLWLLFSYGMLTFSETSVQALRHSQFSLWVSAIIVLLAIRHVLSTLDNARLSKELQSANDDLELRVEERSADLRLSNQELRREMEERERIEMMLRVREENLAHFALHDSLTGLPNRSLLFDRLSQAIQHHRRTKNRYAILFLDLDSFKVVNDSLGHLAGDYLLVQLGQRLSSLVRADDTVARLGGDEFVILIEGFVDKEFVAVVAARVLAAVKEPFVVDKQPIYVTASVGIVIADDDYETAVEIIRDADLAMYKAKSAGKAGYVVFTPMLRFSAIDRLALNSDLHQALELNQFVLHYQPIVSLETGSVNGFEALIRWRHPSRGLLGPAEFIPIAEGNGFIDVITRWSLIEACRQLREWRILFPLQKSLTVSVNLSPFVLRRPELLEWVEEAFCMALLPPDCLTLEIVETALIQDADLAKDAFNQLRSLGVRVSLDDFGVGYSSLGYLNEYPIDYLKIDRSFVSHVATNRKVASIVKSIVQLACELDIHVVAEGIESQNQFNFMKEAGCHYGQGFMVSRPMASHEVSNSYLPQKIAGLPLSITESTVKGGNQ